MTSLEPAYASGTDCQTGGPARSKLITFGFVLALPRSLDDGYLTQKPSLLKHLLMWTPCYAIGFAKFCELPFPEWTNSYEVTFWKGLDARVQIVASRKSVASFSRFNRIYVRKFEIWNCFLLEFWRAMWSTYHNMQVKVVLPSMLPYLSYQLFELCCRMLPAIWLLFYFLPIYCLFLYDYI